MLTEFRKFLARGNALDLAVGVIIGAAFGGIVNSIVQDLITPLLGLLGNRDFTNFYLVLKGNIPPETSYATAKTMGVVLGYGAFLTAVINFLCIAIILFLIIQFGNRLREEKKPAEAPKAPELTKEEQLLTEIRDLLKSPGR